MPWHAEPWQRWDTVTTNPSCDYTKAPMDKNRWIVDELAAAIVRRIFQMCVSGLGPTQIAKKFKAEQAPTLSKYRRSIGNEMRLRHRAAIQLVFPCGGGDFRSPGVCGIPFFQTILYAEETTEKPQEKWKVLLDSHPAIIDRKPLPPFKTSAGTAARTGIVSMFSGLPYCADCVSKLGCSTTDNYKREQVFFFCPAYRSNSDVCSAHFIREIVHEFIDKIVVSKPEKLNGMRHQRVDIHYNTIDLWAAPKPETLEREYLAYYNSMQKRKKTAQQPLRRLSLSKNPPGFFDKLRQIGANGPNLSPAGG